MKDFTEQINDAIAPVTRAWCEPELLRAEVRPESFVGEDEIVVAVLVKMRRRSGAGAIAEVAQAIADKLEKAVHGRLGGPCTAIVQGGGTCGKPSTKVNKGCAMCDECAEMFTENPVPTVETFNEASTGAILPDWTVTGPPPK